MPLARLIPASSTKTKIWVISYLSISIIGIVAETTYTLVLHNYYISLVHLFVVIDIYNFKKYAEVRGVMSPT